MLIVVEGVDGSGKTTLVNELSERLGDDTTVMHRGPLKSHPLIEYEHDLTKYIPGRGQNIICDRWHVGEMVYGPLYRGETRVTPAMRAHIELFLRSRGAHALVVSPPLPIVQYRLANRGEDFLQENHVGLVHDFYTTYAETHDLWNMCDPDDDDEAFISEVISRAEEEESRATEVSRFHSYVGAPSVDVLILGLHRGPQVHGRPHFPSAFVPYSGTSGHYLLSALESVEFSQTATFGLANAAEEPDLYGLWNTLGQPYVFCLGEEVRRRVNFDVDTVTIPHPSQTRRQRPDNVNLYGRVFIQAYERISA